MAQLSVLMLLAALAVGAYQYKENSRFQPEVGGSDDDVTQLSNVKDKPTYVDDMSVMNDINEEDDDDAELLDTLEGLKNDDLQSGDVDYLDTDNDEEDDDYDDDSLDHDEYDPDEEGSAEGELSSRPDTELKEYNDKTARIAMKHEHVDGKSLGWFRRSRGRSMRRSRSYRRRSRSPSYRRRSRSSWFRRKSRSPSYRRRSRSRSRSYRRKSSSRSYRRRSRSRSSRRSSRSRSTRRRSRSRSSRRSSRSRSTRRRSRSRSYRRRSRSRSSRRSRSCPYRPHHNDCTPCPTDCCHSDDEHDDCTPCPENCCPPTRDPRNPVYDAIHATMTKCQFGTTEIRFPVTKSSQAQIEKTVRFSPVFNNLPSIEHDVLEIDAPYGVRFGINVVAQSQSHMRVKVIRWGTHSEEHALVIYWTACPQ